MLDKQPVTTPKFATTLLMKVLGFVFGNDLAWNTLIDILIMKMNQIVHSLRKIKKFLNPLLWNLIMVSEL